MASKKALQQPGFHLPPGRLFSNHKATDRIYAALIGSRDDADEVTIKQGAARTLTSLYQSAVSNKALYKVLRDSNIVWKTIVANATMFQDMERADAKEILEVMSIARKAYVGSTTTELTQLANQYIELVAETASLGPAPTFVVTMPTQPVADMTRTFRELGLTSADSIVLADPRVRAALKGTHPSSATSVLGVLPGSSSPPINLRITLCGIALQHYEPSKAWPLYMTPIGFLNNDLSQDWYEATGHQSKVFGTMDRFLEYAAEALEPREKSAVAGMLTHWVGSPTDFERVVDIVQTDPAHLWTNSPRLRRYATVMIIRWVKDKLQTVWYDPGHNCQEIKQKHGHSSTKIFEYRASVVKKVKKWAARGGVRIYSRYWGGRDDFAPNEYRDDSIKMSLSFLHRLVSANLEVLPAADDDAGFKNNGFILSE